MSNIEKSPGKIITLIRGVALFLLIGWIIKFLPKGTGKFFVSILVFMAVCVFCFFTTVENLHSHTNRQAYDTRALDGCLVMSDRAMGRSSNKYYEISSDEIKENKRTERKDRGLRTRLGIHKNFYWPWESIQTRAKKLCEENNLPYR